MCMCVLCVCMCMCRYVCEPYLKLIISYIAQHIAVLFSIQYKHRNSRKYKKWYGNFNQKV